MTFLDAFNAQMRALLSVPGSPPPVECPKCGAARKVWGATRYETGEPFFVARCAGCRILICPEGHRLQRGSNGPGFNSIGETNVAGCVEDVCGKFRELSGRAYADAASGMPLLFAHHLREWGAFASRKDSTHPGHWMAIVAGRLPMAATFFYTASRDTELNPAQFRAMVPVLTQQWLALA